jgi:hypothetical protein
MAITSSAATTCCEVGFCFPLRTWLRMWPSRSSAIRLFMAPLAALITCRTSEQSRSSSKARTRASTCPRIRLARSSRSCFSLTVWLISITIPSLLIYHMGYGSLISDRNGVGRPKENSCTSGSSFRQVQMNEKALRDRPECPQGKWCGCRRLN